MARVMATVVGYYLVKKRREREIATMRRRIKVRDHRRTVFQLWQSRERLLFIMMMSVAFLIC